ncbi:MAG TPA: alpha/beta fold hydrolase [Paracoccaceae bacterium]|nr:alpha/beta fold hydrolase [Paracoccaceae bacterium]
MTSLGLAGMVVESEGEGPPVLLIHGLGGTSNTWQPLLPWLRGFRLIRPDLPGAGRSPDPQAPLTVALLCETLLAALPHLGIEQAHVVGHSLGALLAQHLAAAAPARVLSLALFGPILTPGDAARERLRARAAMARREGMAAVADQLASALHADAHPAAHAFVRESHMRQDPEGFARSCEALAAAEAADHRLIACPTLIVTGEDDAIAPPSAAYQLADRIAGARVATLARCGHWTPVEKPKECGERLADHLRRAERG